MINRHIRLLLLTSLALAGSSAAAQEPDHFRADQALKQYKQELQGALRAGMSEGAVQAIAACRIQAPEIAGGLSKDGIRIGRASHRLRNPDNAPPEWVEPILNTYIANTADREPRNVPLADGRSGYVEPIMLQPLCTACHGEAISNEVATKLDELYPEDQAVGFRVGDLRGVFWVEYPAE